MCRFVRKLSLVLSLCLLCLLPANALTLSIKNNADVPLLENPHQIFLRSPEGNYQRVASDIVTSRKKTTINPKVSQIYKPNPNGTFAPRATKGAAYETFLKLPLGFRDNFLDICNVQSMAMDTKGRYLYILALTSTSPSCTTARIVRFDVKALQKLGGFDTAGAGFAKLRTATWWQILINQFKAQGKVKYDDRTPERKAEDKALRACMTIGPVFDSGHGQSLAYNPKTKELWMWKVFLTWDSKYTAGNSTILRISTNTLVPARSLNFAMKRKNGDIVLPGQYLTFDTEGNAYFYHNSAGNAQSTDPSGSLHIFKGKVKGNAVYFDAVQNIRNSVAGSPQGLSYNPKDKTLVLVFDGAMMEVKSARLGKLTPADIKSTVFDTRREFEGMTYMPNGTGLMLLTGSPEILREKS